MALFLSNEDVERILKPKEVVEVMRVALKDYGLKRALNSPRIRLPLSEGIFRSMMSTIPSLDVAGLKQGMWLSSEKEGRTKDVERRTELVSVYSISEGRLLAIINSHRLNELRTAAASAIATECLAKKGAASVGIIGTGPHALAHLEVLGDVIKLEETPTRCNTSNSRDVCPSGYRFWVAFFKRKAGHKRVGRLHPYTWFGICLSPVMRGLNN